MSELDTLDALLSLQGKTALITGSAGGIGKAIARRFAEAGAALELVDIDAKSLDTTGSELSIIGPEVKLHTLDLTDKTARDRLWDAMGPAGPDILVNNAGIYPFREFIDVDEAFYRRVMETNLDSVYWMCQKLVRRRIKSGGVIINLSSIEAVLPLKDDLATYSVSKSGVIALTRALAKEHARHGIRVNAILPGGIITPGTKAAAKGILDFKFDLLKTGYDFRQRLPIGRFGQPDEVARVALMLASDFSSYVHGAAIPVDGGFLSA
jgi:NAD(P)-dependent dehydrogenase (short-subunit alcohol dehydrogenase family)